MKTFFFNYYYYKLASFSFLGNEKIIIINNWRFCRIYGDCEKEYGDKKSLIKNNLFINEPITIFNDSCTDNSSFIDDLTAINISYLCKINFLKDNIIHDKNSGDNELENLNLP